MFCVELNPAKASFWFAVAPALVVLAIITTSLTVSLTRLPWTSNLHKLHYPIRRAFKPFLPLHENSDSPIVSSWARSYSIFFALTALVECLAWLATASFYLVLSKRTVWDVACSFLVAFSWLYLTVRPIIRPKATVPRDALCIYLLLFFGAALQLGECLFENLVSGTPMPPLMALLGASANLAVLLTLLSVTMSLPINLPPTSVKKEDIGYSVSPEDYTSPFGWLTYNWVYTLIERGTKTTLEEKDVWTLSPTMQSKPIFAALQSLKSTTLLWRLWEANSLDILLDFSGTLGSVVFAYGGPFFLKRLLDAIDRPDKTSRDVGVAYIYAGLMFGSALLKAQFDVQHLWYGQRAATRIRSELVTSIYDKALKRKDFSGIIDPAKSSTPKQNASQNEAKATTGADTGKIVNLISGDAERIATIVSSMYYLYGAPLELVVGSVFLYNLLGWSAFSGFIAIVVGVPLNNYLAQRNARINKAILTAKDKRMGEVTELIDAIKFVKFFAWEEIWIKRVMAARNEEMAWRLKGRLNNVLFQCVWSITPILLSIISFFTYVWTGGQLTIGKAFAALALFAMIRAPLNYVPIYYVEMIQARIALDRIAVFLEEPEISEQVSSLKKSDQPELSGYADDRLGFINASFKWNHMEQSSVTDTWDDSSTFLSEDVPSFQLKDISVSFPEGVLTVVTGPTAGGKTVLLLAVLGEMSLLPGGQIILSKNPSEIDEWGNMHTISYAAQTPWLRNESIRDNILFGHPWDEQRYYEVLECCALNPDFELLEDGDRTEIGAGGISLSGGQKARVALARACYARTKWVLLDDPLSAVDSHTARFLCDKLLRGPLLANRTVVLVTHHLEMVLPGAHYLIRMKDGRIDHQGTLDDLRTQGLLQEIIHEAAVESKEEELEVPPASSEPTPEDDMSDDPAPKVKTPRKLVEDEHRETGSVKWSVYNTYLGAAGYWVWGVFVVLVLIQQLTGVGEKVWFKVWGKAYEGRSGFVPRYAPYGVAYGLRLAPLNGWPSAMERPLLYAGIYTAIGLFGVFVRLGTVVMEHTGALGAARVLHRRLLNSVVRATFRFHDTTPQGRLLNRFGSDTETADNQIAWQVVGVTSAIGGFFVSVITVLAVFPLFFVPATVLGYFYYALARGYMNTGRDLRRMESNSRSPIFSDFATLLTGIVTVRAFSAERKVRDKLYERLDASIQLWYALWVTNRWLLLNFEFLGSIAVFATACFSVAFLRDDAGIAGLAISSALSFSQGVYLTLRFSTTLELDLNSVERIVEYTNLPQEPPAIVQSNRPPAYWPSSSAVGPLIILDEVVVRYAPELPPVLRGISLSLRGGERVGVVGRTGSGKSTLAMALLRFVDPSSGKIVIDGIDISQIGTQDLRSRITLIPQDPALFSGTLRENLDPLGEFEDSACINVLSRVHLLSPAPSKASTRPPSVIHDSASMQADSKIALSLDTAVSAGGANFSQGQKQLIALARALLRRCAIVILDEATSSVDMETEAKIQTTIREEFSGSLLITIAHRLRTIMDYDRVVVLDKGTVVDVDSPLEVMKRDGIFRRMCLRSGSYIELEAIAVGVSHDLGQLTHNGTE